MERGIFRVEKAGAQESGAKGLGENMKKEKILKEDGRYLIFYSFRDEAKESSDRLVSHELDGFVERQTRRKEEEKTRSLDTEGNCSR